MSIRVLKYMRRKKDVHAAATIQNLAGTGTTQWPHISHMTARAYLFRLRRTSAPSPPPH
jgi:hypothetical protein